MNILNAAAIGNTRKVKKLLMAGMFCDWQSPTGHTPLVKAAECGHHMVVELLLAKGANVNQAVVLHGMTRGVASAVYRTPLLCPVENGVLKVVEVLFAKGADVNNVEQIGCTPLYMAAEIGLPYHS